MKFTNNRAYRGGGLYSYNNVIEFKSPLTLIFYSNKAKDIGGAIFYEKPYVDPLKVTRSINCFCMVTVDNDSFSHIYQYRFCGLSCRKRYGYIWK